MFIFNKVNKPYFKVCLFFSPTNKNRNVFELKSLCAFLQNKQHLWVSQLFPTRIKVPPLFYRRQQFVVIFLSLFQLLFLCRANWRITWTLSPPPCLLFLIKHSCFGGYKIWNWGVACVRPWLFFYHSDQWSRTCSQKILMIANISI